MSNQQQKQAVDPKAFMAALASCNEACSTMDFSGGGWTPPVGQYDVQIADVMTGQKVKDGQTNFWIKPVFEIIPESEHAGRQFSEFMYITPGAGELTAALRTLLNLATCLAGNEVRQADEAFDILSKSIGSFLSLEITQRAGKGKYAGRTFTNTRFLERIESETTA